MIFFEDKTLRVDYIFTGDAGHLDIYLDDFPASPSGQAAGTICLKFL